MVTCSVAYSLWQLLRDGWSRGGHWWLVQVRGQQWDSTGGGFPICTESGIHCGFPKPQTHGPLTSVGGGERRGASRGRIWALATIWQIALACNSTELDPLVREAVVISAFRFPHWLRLSPSPSLLSCPGLHAQSLPRLGFWGGKCNFLYDSDSEQFTFYSLRLQESPLCPVPTPMRKHLHFLQGPGKQGVRAEAMASGGS